MTGGEHGNRLAGLGTRSTSDCQAEQEQRTVFDLLRDTEIGNLDAAFVVNEDVPAFDVSVDDIFLMEIG